MSQPLISVVGPCGAGKTTLVSGLRARGVNSRQTSQEHSYVRDMWRRLAQPDLLVYLDARLDTIRSRLNDPAWPAWLREQQVERLRHARLHCNLYIETDGLTPEEVLERVLAALDDCG
ncbi:MAG: hypothetical protein FJ011_06380 [Chloroflexi bacterium]|nr:hypothetical protein [Chloroflexota bacterium]